MADPVAADVTAPGDRNYPVAIVAGEAPARTRPSNYPEPFASRMAGRRKQPLGDLFGLANFGVNLTRLAPGAVSALRHAHTKQDEFVYILQGHPTLHTDEGSTRLAPGTPKRSADCGPISPRSVTRSPERHGDRDRRDDRVLAVQVSLCTLLHGP